MLRKILVGAVVLLCGAGAGVYFWARAVLSGDTVRTAVEAQLTQDLGQPVHVGHISATILPRITMSLEQVSIGPPDRLTIGSLEVGTDFRALLSRRIEHATARLSGARVVLPLPEFAFSSTTAPGTSSGAPPVEIVSIDQILLQQVELVSGGRTLKADIDLAPQGRGVLVRHVTIGAGDASLSVTGEITDLAGPSGELTVKASQIDVLSLLSFVADFTREAVVPAGAAASGSSGGAAASAIDVALNLEAGRVLLGGLTLDALTGRARVTPAALTLEPIAFQVFGGKYAGTLALTPGETPAFRLRASLSGLEMAKAMAFVGTPDKIRGTLAGTIDLAGRGTSADAVMRTLRGTARLDLTDGSVKGLGLLPSVILATSMRADAPKAGVDPAAPERFERLGATLTVADGSARTSDLRFESPDLLLSATGSIRLDGSAVDLSGPVQLSDALSKQAGRDLVRYTQEGGRVTLPATVSGPATDLKVRVDVGDVAKRAIRNRANEEAGKAIKKGLGGLLGR